MVCFSAAAQDQTIDVALVFLLVPIVVLITTGRGRFADLEMHLFEDARQQHPMVTAGGGVPQVLHEVGVPSQSQTQLNIPFFAQIFVSQVLPAGT